MALEDDTYAGFKCFLQSPELETELERRGVRGPRKVFSTESSLAM